MAESGPPGPEPAAEAKMEWLATAAIGGVVLLSSTLFAPGPWSMVPVTLAFGAVAVGSFPWRRALTLVWRLKWFYLSLVLFFGWLHPSAATEGAGRLLPAAEGLAHAGWRIGALLLVVGWVVWLTSSFHRDTQIQGLTRWLRPLRPLGIRGEVFAGRLFLALAEFEGRQETYQGFRSRRESGRLAYLKAGREFLIRGLERALAGNLASPGGVGAEISGRCEGTTRAFPVLAAQVLLLWLASLVSLVLRSILPA